MLYKIYSKYSVYNLVILNCGRYIANIKILTFIPYKRSKCI